MIHVGLFKFRISYGSMILTYTEQNISCLALVSHKDHGSSVWLSELHTGAFKALLLMQLTSATVEETNRHKGIKKKMNSEETNKL